jgi:hypothetical protein
MDLGTNVVDAIQPVLQAAVMERRIVLWGTAGLAGGGLGLVVLLLWTIWRLREIGQLRERLSRLADGLALLTDTTETGLATIARQVEQATRKPAPAAGRTPPRSTVSRRVTAAARRGDAVAEIARREALSESEVRLHLSLAQAAASRPTPGGHAPASLEGE